MELLVSRDEAKIHLFNIWPLRNLKRRSLVFAVKLLSKRERLLLVTVIIVTLILAILDLVGVALIGVIGSLSITGISSAQTGDRVSKALGLLKIESLDFESQIIVVSVLAAILLIGKTILSLILIRRTLFFMARRSAVVSADLVSRYFTIPVSRINQRSVQSSIYALTGGVEALMVGVVGVSVALISDIVLLLVMSLGLFVVDPMTALSTVVIFSLLAYVLYVNMHKTMGKIGQQHAAISIETAQRIYEVINSYRELLVRDRRGFYAAQIGGLRHKLANNGAKAKFMGSLSKYIMEITLVLSAVLLAFYQFSIYSGARAIATITIFVAASSRIIPAILRIQQGVLGMKGAVAQAHGTVSLIEELTPVAKRDYEAKKISRSHLGFKSSVAATNIYFSYQPSTEVLRNVNFRVSEGEFVAIVGGSGAGKTTLVDVILGALEAQSGQVEISGLAPNLTFSKWPGAVSYVPQESPVINGTIRENLGLGYPLHEIEDQFCWESLRVANLDEFVRSLPDRLDTFVGDRGTRLSGGQKQRLGIARALITNPRLLILDEATSSLDGITELGISDQLKKLKTKTTLIVIAHRLSTVVKADRIYFMQDGIIKSEGTFEVLKLQNPEFLAQAELMGL